MGVNAYVVDGDEGVILIDTGLPRRHGRVLKKLSEIGRSTDDIAAIVLTHAHADHTGGAAALSALSAAPVVAPIEDASAIAGASATPPPPILDRAMLRWLMALIPDADPVQPTQTIEAGQVPGVAALTAVATPGHTPGHTSYLLDRSGGVMFVGDAAMAGRSGRVHRGYMNRRGAVFDRSLTRLASHDFEVACFGHSSPILERASQRFGELATSL